MPSFICDVVTKPARSRELDQTGYLTLRTEVAVGADYRVMPVRVAVEFVAIFMPDRKFWEHADDDPEERYAVHYSKSFSTPEERQFHCMTFYELLSPTA